jgi:drug/metabolite transporter (DMT)-like permease
MSPFWILIAAAIVMAAALLIKYLGEEVLDEEHHFISMIMGFFVIYVTAAVAIGMLNPLDLLPGTSPEPTILSLPF